METNKAILLDRVRNAQKEAGERVVLQDLHERKLCDKDSCPFCQQVNPCADIPCQEASQFSTQTYIPCGRPGVGVVWHSRDKRAYVMCEACLDHNVRNRGGVLLVDGTPGDARAVAALTVVERFGSIDGGHHQKWLLDQVVRHLTGAGYHAWVKEWRDAGHTWETGTPP